MITLVMQLLLLIGELYLALEIATTENYKKRKYMAIAFSVIIGIFILTIK
jgi:hypothetical protein